MKDRKCKISECSDNTNHINGIIGKEDESKVRIRRTQSVAKVESITDGERKVRNIQNDRPLHVVRDSLFSWSSGFDRFEGFINWGALLLMLGGFRLFLENVIKYGIRISPLYWASWLYTENKKDYFHTPLFLILSNGHYLFTFFLEKLMSKNILPGNVGIVIQFIHLIIMLFIPVVVLRIWGTSFSVVGRTIICFVYIIEFLKLWSYVHVNFWCRSTRRKWDKFIRRRTQSFRDLFALDSGEDEGQSNYIHKKKSSYEPVAYPANLTLKDLYYFLIAPTLCYELNFPRSNRIRIRFLLRRLLEMFILSNLLLGLFQQWIIPTVRNSFKPFAEMDYMKCTERILKLAIPNHLLWLIFFYSFFHSYLNTMGELLRFGDRNFYQDWWNSKDVGTFWKLWNLPVHNWCVRHLFVPLLKSKYSRTAASLSVFLLSAFFHEYIVSVPLNMYKIHVFLGMMVQVPLVAISEIMSKRFGERVGNLMVWASLILGQPIGIMVYYHDYIIKNFSPETLSIKP